MKNMQPPSKKYIAWVNKKGVEQKSYHESFSKAKQWIGYMVWAHEAKPLRIETPGGEVLTDKIVTKW